MSGKKEHIVSISGYDFSAVSFNHRENELFKQYHGLIHLTTHVFPKTIAYMLFSVGLFWQHKLTTPAPLLLPTGHETTVICLFHCN